MEEHEEAEERRRLECEEAEERRRQECKEAEERRRQQYEEARHEREEARCARKELEERRERCLDWQLQQQSKMLQMMMIAMMGDRVMKRKRDNCD